MIQRLAVVNTSRSTIRWCCLLSSTSLLRREGKKKERRKIPKVRQGTSSSNSVKYWWRSVNTSTIKFYLIVSTIVFSNLSPMERKDSHCLGRGRIGDLSQLMTSQLMKSSKLSNTTCLDGLLREQARFHGKNLCLEASLMKSSSPRFERRSWSHF